MMSRTPRLKGKALFLETSAQIFRLVGNPEMQRDIDELIHDAKKVGSSRQVLREFQAVYGRLYDQVDGALVRVTNPYRARPVADLWNELLHLLPPRTSGGDKLLASFTAKVCARYGQDLVKPAEVRGFIAGQKKALMENFIYGDVFTDFSTCCVWPNEKNDSCSRRPKPECCLKAICLDRREAFLASAQTLAKHKREESKWLEKNLDLLIGAQGIALLELVGKNPNPFGDLIIFWETPNGWTILTRDRTFSILKESHRPDLNRVHYTRLYRNKVSNGRKCKVQPLRAGGRAVPATLLNYTSRGVCVIAKEELGKRGGKILLDIKGKFGGKVEGEIAWRGTPPHKFVWGIKIPIKQK